MSTEIATTSKTQIALAETGLRLTSLEDLWRFANCVKASGFAPKGYESPESIVVGVQFGAELGLSPMNSLQNIAVIQGRPSIFGDAAKALVLGSGLCESFSETLRGEGDALTAICKVTRRGFPDPIICEFSVADAKKASLWGKQGPWTQYPKRMLQMRARSFALRDAFPDVLKGLSTREEVQDIIDHEEINAIVAETGGIQRHRRSRAEVVSESPTATRTVQAEVVEDTEESPAAAPPARRRNATAAATTSPVTAPAGGDDDLMF